MFPTLHPSHARLETGDSCPSIQPFSARGSLADTKTSQRLVEAIYLININYRSPPPERQAEFCLILPNPRLQHTKASLSGEATNRAPSQSVPLLRPRYRKLSEESPLPGCSVAKAKPVVEAWERHGILIGPSP
jgi:hypothetical protein